MTNSTADTIAAELLAGLEGYSIVTMVAEDGPPHKKSKWIGVFDLRAILSDRTALIAERDALREKLAEAGQEREELRTRFRKAYLVAAFAEGFKDARAAANSDGSIIAVPHYNIEETEREKQWCDGHDAFNSLRTRLTTAAALIKEAGEAMEPFAEQAKYYDPDEQDGTILDNSTPVSPEANAGQLRAIRTLAAKLKEFDNGQPRHD